MVITKKKTEAKIRRVIQLTRTDLTDPETAEPLPPMLQEFTEWTDYLKVALARNAAQSVCCIEYDVEGKLTHCVTRMLGRAKSWFELGMEGVVVNIVPDETGKA